VSGGIVSTAILMSAKDAPHSSESVQTSAIERPVTRSGHPTSTFTIALAIPDESGPEISPAQIGHALDPARRGLSFPAWGGASS
jgi:hypothetical protein